MAKGKHPTVALRVSQRVVNFLLYQLNIDYGDVAFPNTVHYLDAYIVDKSKISSNILNKPYLLVPRSFLLPEESIHWLASDLRASIWFYAYMSVEEKDFNLSMCEYGDFQKDLLLGIDCSLSDERPLKRGIWSYNLRKKKYSLNYAKALYSNFRTKVKHLNWLNPNDENQLQWAIDHLEEKELLIKPPTFIPITNKDLYAQICASLDVLDLFERSSFLNKEYIESKKNEVVPIKEVVEKKDSKYVKMPFGQNIGTDRELIDDDSVDTNDVEEPEVEAKAAELQSHLNGQNSPFEQVYSITDFKKKSLKNMRNSWNQKTSRDKEDKKRPSDFKLPHGYNKKLNEIAEAYGLQDSKGNINNVACLKQILDKEHADIQKI